MSRRTALVTGATGYIGARLTRHLVKLGWAVHAIVRSRSQSRLPPGCIAHLYDGEYDAIAAAVRAAGEGAVVFHLAAQASGYHVPSQTTEMVAANILMPLHLIEAGANHGIRHFVNTGSFWQHAAGTAEYAPFSLYAATKQAFEDLATWYVRDGRMAVDTLVLFDVYGPDDPRAKIVPLMMRAAATGESLNMSPGQQCLYLVHVDDVVAAYCVAADKTAMALRCPGRYAVRPSKSHSLREVAALVGEVAGRPVPIRWGARPYREGEIMRPWPEGDTLPGWSPRIDLDSGLRQLWSIQPPFPSRPL